MEKLKKLLDETLLFIAQKGWSINEYTFFDSLTLFLADKLNADFVFISRLSSIDNYAETLSFVAHGKIKENIKYSLKNTHVKK